MPELKIQLLRDIPLPAYGRDGDAALDLCAVIEAPTTLAVGDRMWAGTGFNIAIPAGYVGLVLPRSGLGSRGLTFVNNTGAIDSNYRGEIKLHIINTGVEPLHISPLDKIAQLLIMPVATVTVTPVDSLDETVRGTDGFGSSGR
ncbi:MAG: dUTP diphosphatase [Alphaproteobacteria bacterium CG_4_10_14_0_8_um_filter_53_9]|nr:MAG: dUTP diphosphatase [Alphaproteobacteria bacterium CG_4_10_14_0_8_um_filter_53_9]